MLESLVVHCVGLDLFVSQLGQTLECLLFSIKGKMFLEAVKLQIESVRSRSSCSVLAIFSLQGNQQPGGGAGGDKKDDKVREET